MKHADYLAEIERDPEYHEAKEALQARFTLGDTVLRSRIERGWSQTELAARVGTKQANISRIEAGLANPTLDLIQKIIRVLELNINFSPRSTSTTYLAIHYPQYSLPESNWSRSISETTHPRIKPAKK